MNNPERFDLTYINDKNEKVGYWMGANDVGRESFYVWLDGSKGKFTN